MSQSLGTTFGLVELQGADDLFDAHGHVLHKKLLDAFYKRLEGWGREGDKSRKLDNGRFCVVLNGVTGHSELQLATSKLSRMFEEPFDVAGTPIHLRVTIGFAELDGASPDLNTALLKAGKALTAARRSASFFKVYTPELEVDNVEELDLVRRLDAAVERGEMQLYYQPKIHAGYRTLVGAEALMRWHTADKQVITPGEFMPVAERNDVIVPMTWWAIKSAVARLALWPTELSVAVNVTPSLLLDDTIIDIVSDSLDMHLVKPSRLTIEVTESIMVDNQTVMTEQLARLRELGVKVSIDDFGTGFSSMSYFRDLPADEIKIDMSFVIPMLTSKKDHAIVKAVIDLAHNFSLRVVAEGVENEETADRLGELGCDIMQGYFFDKPLPVELFESQYKVFELLGKK